MHVPRLSAAAMAVKDFLALEARVLSGGGGELWICLEGLIRQDEDGAKTAGLASFGAVGEEEVGPAGGAQA